jgi:hypothetical protein
MREPLARMKVGAGAGADGRVNRACLKQVRRSGDHSAMNHARAKVLVARAIALLVAVCLFAWPEVAPPPGESPFGGATSFLGVVARYSALAWIALAIGPWPRLAPVVSWWPGGEPHNLYGLAALITALLGAAGLLFASIFIVGCVVLAMEHKLSIVWLAAAFIASAIGVFGIWASPRAQARALERDAEHAG